MINYRVLLKKYMIHVSQSTGSAHLDGINVEYVSNVRFTKEEQECLETLDEEHEIEGETGEVIFPVDNPDLGSYIGQEIRTGKNAAVEFDQKIPYIVRGLLSPERYAVIKQILNQDMSLSEEIVATCYSEEEAITIKNRYSREMSYGPVMRGEGKGFLSTEFKGRE